MRTSSLAWATRIRPTVVAAIRALPDVRGRGRLAHVLNRALLKAKADPKAVASMCAGYSLIVDCRLFAHASALYTGHAQDAMIRSLVRFLRPGGTALDVGANVGFVTVPLAIAARGVDGRVVAVEPLQKNAALLRENLSLNQVEEFVTIVEAGLSSTAHDAELLLREDFETGAEVGNASVAEAGIDEHFAKVSIRLETLDELWPALGSPRLDIVKVDIEGHEDRFLEGGTRTISSFRPVLMMEMNNWFYERREVKFEQLIPSLLPTGYRACSSALKPFEDLGALQTQDLLFVPEEKLKPAALRR